MVWARCRGSSASGASGLPCATSQNGQRRVQMSPRIMKVAVPLPKHSPMLGQDASSHTVCSFCSRRMRLMSWKRESELGARTRIQAGLASASRGTILMGMRAVFSAPFSFTPGSRMLEPRDQELYQFSFKEFFRPFKSHILHLRYRKARIAAGIDRGKRREVHVDVEGEAVVGAAARHANAERGDLRALHVNPGSAGPAFAAPLEKVDHRLLEQPHEALHPDAAPREIDQGVEHDLAGAVIRDLAAPVRAQHRDAVLDRGGLGALSQRVDRRMLDQPDFIRARRGSLRRESAHRLQGRLVFGQTEMPEKDACGADFGDFHQSTITTDGWSHSS